MSGKRKDRKTKEEIKGKTEREYPKKCLECGGIIVKNYEKAELYCDSCGLVVKEDIVDLGPEWRSYDSEQAREKIRVGPPISYRIHDKGLKIPIDESLKGKEKNAGINKTRDRSFTFALSQIERMASALGLPENIREDASLLYRKAMREKILKGRSIEEVTSAILFIVCRQYRVPRTLKEIEKVSWVKKKKISGAKKFLLRKLGLKIPPAIPCHFVPRFCFLLDLNKITESKALEIAGKIKLNNGQSPTGIAAAAISMAAKLNNQRCLQKEITDIAEVSGATIRNRYKEISEQLGINIPATEN